MKKLTFLLIFIANISFAQDLIVTKKNDSIKCNIVSVNPGFDYTYTLKYLTFNNKDSIMNTIDFNKIKSIKTEKIDILNTFYIYSGSKPIITKKTNNKNETINIISFKNITVGDELIIHANHQYTGLILSLIGSGISIAGSISNNQTVIYSGAAISFIGVIYFIESIEHIKNAGKKLNNSMK